MASRDASILIRQIECVHAITDRRDGSSKGIYHATVPFGGLYVVRFGFVVDDLAGTGLPLTKAAASLWLLNFLNRAPAKPLTNRSASGQLPNTPVALPLATA